MCWIILVCILSPAFLWFLCPRIHLLLTWFSLTLFSIAIMNYDIFGSWSSAAGPNAPLDDSCSPIKAGSATYAVNSWFSAGFPVNKVSMDGTYTHRTRHSCLPFKSVLTLTDSPSIFSSNRSSSALHLTATASMSPVPPPSTRQAICLPTHPSMLPSSPTETRLIPRAAWTSAAPPLARVAYSTSGP